MNRTQAEEFERNVNRIALETRETRQLIQTLLDLFICEACDGEGIIYNANDEMETCTNCDGKGYTRTVGTP